MRNRLVAPLVERFDFTRVYSATIEVTGFPPAMITRVSEAQEVAAYLTQLSRGEHPTQNQVED